MGEVVSFAAAVEKIQRRKQAKKPKSQPVEPKSRIEAAIFEIFERYGGDREHWWKTPAQRHYFHSVEDELGSKYKDLARIYAAWRYYNRILGDVHDRDFSMRRWKRRKEFEAASEELERGTQ